ncbi:MAG: hypothetical protein KKH28_03515 [Elusimicrobia bacterium]|nr:hypothetical protein [Elusimicrobiota bacterium]
MTTRAVALCSALAALCALPALRAGETTTVGFKAGPSGHGVNMFTAPGSSLYS